MEISSPFYCTWVEAFSDFWQICFVQSCQNCSLHVQTNILMNFFWKNLEILFFLSDFEPKPFLNFGKKGKVVKTLFYVFSIHTEETDFSFFLLFLFLMYIHTFSETVSDFWHFFIANLSKMLSTRSDEHLDEKQFLWKILLFLRILGETSSEYWQKFHRKFAKTVFYVFWKRLTETDFS